MKTARGGSGGAVLPERKPATNQRSPLDQLLHAVGSNPEARGSGTGSAAAAAVSRKRPLESDPIEGGPQSVLKSNVTSAKDRKGDGPKGEGMAGPSTVQSLSGGVGVLVGPRDEHGEGKGDLSSGRKPPSPAKAPEFLEAAAADALLVVRSLSGSEASDVGPSETKVICQCSMGGKESNIFFVD